MSKETERLLERIAALEIEKDELQAECDGIQSELDAEEKENQALDEKNEELKSIAQGLCDLLEEAKEYVPSIAVYGIDHRRIEEATRDARR